MRIALLADTHIGTRADADTFLDQHELFFEEVFFPKLESEGITKIIHLGDLFDKTKSINFKTLSRFKKMFIKPFLEKKMEMWIIHGNHDSYYRDSSEVTSVEEILGEYESIHVFSEPGERKIGGRNFVFLPWQHSGEIPIDLPTGEILCTHLSMVGYEMSKGFKNLDKGIDPSTFNMFKRVISGDFHHPNGPYIGAPIELRWDDYGGPRGFQILDTKDLALEYVKNPNRVFRKMNYDDTKETLESLLKKDFSIFKGVCVRVHVKACKDRYLLDQFVKAVKDAGAFLLSVIEFRDGDIDIDDVAILDHSQSPRNIIREFIDQKDIAADKEELFRFMEDLYTRAEKTMTLVQVG